MNGVQTLLLAFDHSLLHPWESLALATEGLTEEQAVWQHPAYSRVPHDKGIGKPGTVLWYLNHLEYCHRYYTAILRNRPNENRPEVRLPGELELQPVQAALENANAKLRDEIENLNNDELEEPCTRTRTTVEFLHGVLRHISWHSGQIATVRRLYASR